MNNNEYHMIKDVKTYSLTDTNGRQFKQNIKDIYFYNKSKHLALILTTKKEFLIIRNLIYLNSIGYANIAQVCSKELAQAKEEYLEYSSNFKK